MKAATLMVALVVLIGACGGPPPKPGCAPGSGSAIAAECKAAMALGDATLADCDAKVNAWEAGCLR